MLYLVVRSLAFLLFKTLFRLKIFGQENVPLKGGMLLAANHTSYLDPPILGAACPRVVHFMAKESLFNNGLFGRFISRLNAFPVQEGFSDIGSVRRALRELKRGRAVTIFPEGRRTADGRMGRPLRGIGLLSIKAVCPIVPVFIEGSYEAWPRQRKFFRLHKIKVYFGKPFCCAAVNPPAGNKELYRQLAERTIAEIKNLRDSSR